MSMPELPGPPSGQPAGCTRSTATSGGPGHGGSQQQLLRRTGGAAGDRVGGVGVAWCYAGARVAVGLGGRDPRRGTAAASIPAGDVGGGLHHQQQPHGVARHAHRQAPRGRRTRGAAHPLPYGHLRRLRSAVPGWPRQAKLRFRGADPLRLWVWRNDSTPPESHSASCPIARGMT